MRVRELRKSHLLPKWVFRRIQKFGTTSNAIPVEIDNGVMVRTSKQPTEYLLCDDCEQRLSVWEDHAARLAVQPDGSFPALDAMPILQRFESGVEQWKGNGTALGMEMALFAASLCWRASVSDEYNVDLGPHAEQFRQFLLGLTTTLPDARLTVTLVDRRTKAPVHMVAAHPSSYECDGYRDYQVTVPGITFTFSVGKTLPDRFDVCCFIRTRFVWGVDGKQMARWVSRKMRASKRKGRW